MAGPIAFLVPDPIQSTQLIPGGNIPASGGLLFVYQVGSTTKSNSYTDPSASTARTNPIVLDSGGNIPGNGEVWITSSAKFVLAPSNDTDPPSSPYWTRDNYYGINNITAAQVQALSAQSEWVQGSTAVFVGVTQFSITGDQTTLYTLGRRIKAAVTGGDRFGIVTSAVLSTGSTAVGVTLDSGTLNGGLSSIQYGILSTPNGSVPWTVETTSGASIFASAVTSNAMTIGSSTGTTILSYVLKRKSISESVVSSIVLQNDDDLFFPIGASEEWLGTLNLGITMGTGGLNLALNAPAGATMEVNSLYIGGTLGEARGTNQQTPGLTFLNVTSAANGAVRAAFWVLNSTNSGSVNFQFAENTSTSVITMRKGSFMEATRIT